MSEMATIQTLVCFLNHWKQPRRNNKWKGVVLGEFYRPLQYYLIQYTTNNLRHEKHAHVLSRLGFRFFFFLYHIYFFNANSQKVFRSIFLVFLLPQSSNQVQPNKKLLHYIPGAPHALKCINYHRFQHSKRDSGGHFREMPCPPSLSSAAAVKWATSAQPGRAETQNSASHYCPNLTFF